MPSRTKLTNSSDETEVARLISGDTVFTIPYFQRPYKWKPDKLNQLNKDILAIIDEDDSHFLGAVIIHGVKSNPADPNLYDIIDGQQRVTTLILYLAAIVRTLCLEGYHDEAYGLFSKYLVIPRATNLASNYKLQPCKEDRKQINTVYAQLLSDKKLSDLLGFKMKKLPSTGKDKGPLKNNYNAALRFIKAQVDSEGIERLRDIYTAILEDISVVQIDVWDPTNGPKIFDALNSRQEPMTIGDLVRNAIFSKVASDEIEEIEQIDEHSWQPFYGAFQDEAKNLFDGYFFPYGLIKNNNLKKSEVFNYLRDQWIKKDDPTIIITELTEYQDAFIDIITGSNRQEHNDPIKSILSRLTLSGLPTSTYPFLMQLSNGIKNETISINDGKQCLEVVESFLIRRAICGHEPTGLHAVFKRLWQDCEGMPNKERVIAALQRHKTVTWPDDTELNRCIKSRSLYGSAVTNYLLIQYDDHLKGDKPKNISWIEHVLPESMSETWKENFTAKEHLQLKDTLANLLPLDPGMNIKLGNKSYSIKRERFVSDSAFKSTREFGKEYHNWTPSDIQTRATHLADWAMKRWPY